MTYVLILILFTTNPAGDEFAVLSAEFNNSVACHAVANSYKALDRGGWVVSAACWPKGTRLAL